MIGEHVPVPSDYHVPMPPRPKVTQAEFEQIECNRCGACCTKLWLPSPLKLVEYLDLRSQVTDPSPEWLLENDRFVRWLSRLEPTGEVHTAREALDQGTHQYRCTRFVRDENGNGFCTEYEDRPNACRGFPYGRPVHAKDFEECSYNVEIVEDSPVRKGLRWLRGKRD
jgi:Fe-S-cluster containining protein